MKKKKYIKPVVSVIEMETTAILAGSVIQKAEDVDYSDENVKDFWDNSTNKGIWADQPLILYRTPPGSTSVAWGKIKRGCVISHIQYALKGQKLLAQGIALGFKTNTKKSP